MARSPIADVLADNVRMFAEKRSLALSVLADRAGVSRRQLFGVLAGERGATIEWVEKLADVLELEVSELLERHTGAAVVTAQVSGSS